MASQRAYRDQAACKRESRRGMDAPGVLFCATDRGLYTVVQTLRPDSRAEKPWIANQDVLKSKELTS